MFVIKTTAFLSDKQYFSSNYSETHHHAQFICKADHSKWSITTLDLIHIKSSLKKRKMWFFSVFASKIFVKKIEKVPSFLILSDIHCFSTTQQRGVPACALKLPEYSILTRELLFYFVLWLSVSNFVFWILIQKNVRIASQKGSSEDMFGNL